jgi:hypothetical protein
MAIAVPPKLFKYQPLRRGSHTIENLEKRQLWSSESAQFNDPFDCAIPYRLLKISRGRWLNGYSAWRAWFQGERGAAAARDRDSQYLTNGVPNRAFIDALTKVVDANIQKMRQGNEKTGVCCFSATLKSILMWSHYADGHKGVCLEFDTELAPFADTTKVHPIDYESVYPALDPVFYLPIPADLGILSLRTKSREWKYEMEWRLLTPAGRMQIPYPAEALTGVYFGCRMSSHAKTRIKALLANSPTRLFQMKRSQTKYALEYEPYHPSRARA